MYTPRYIFRLTIAFLSRFKALILIGIIFGIVIFFLINFLVPVIDTPQKERIGIVGRYTASNLPEVITHLIGNGLTKISPSGEVEPDLASSWTTEDSGKTWTFKLKDNLKWQDGKKLTSADINYNFSDLTIEKPDANTIVFKLQNPYASFPAVVSRPVFKKGLLGTGLYSVKKINLNGTYVESIILINEEKKQIIYKFYPTEDRAKMAFKLGEVDALQGIVNKDTFAKWDGLKIESEFNYGEYVVVFLNTKNPKLGDKSIRQTLNYAIDKDSLGDERSFGPISKNSWAYNSQVKPYTFDQAKAKKTVDELADEVKNNLSITLSTSSILLPTAEKVAKYWESIGIKTNISVYTSVPDDYEAMLVIFDIPEDPDQYSIWHSTQERSNISKIQNPRIDKLLEDGRIQTDITERKKIYFDFQRFLVEEAPAIFLYYPESYTINRR